MAVIYIWVCGWYTGAMAYKIWISDGNYRFDRRRAMPHSIRAQVRYMLNFSFQDPVLKIRSHGSHGRGTKGIWGDQRDVIVSFGPPKIIVLFLKFHL